MLEEENRRPPKDVVPLGVIKNRSTNLPTGKAAVADQDCRGHCESATLIPTRSIRFHIHIESAWPNVSLETGVHRGQVSYVDSEGGSAPHSAPKPVHGTQRGREGGK